MSETESWTGRLIPVESKGTVEETAKYILEKKYGVTELHKWYDNYIEQFKDTAYKEYFIIGDIIYEGDLRYVQYEDIAEVTLNPDGTINITVQFHNGGCSLDEAVTAAVQQNINLSDTKFKLVDGGPWRLYYSAPPNKKLVGIISDDFTHDVVLNISGDFANDDQFKQYCELLAKELNSRPKQNLQVMSEYGVGDWCHPGDDPQQRWVIVFEDNDVPMSIYYDEQEAITAFRRAECMGWNCHLFTSVPRKVE